MAYTGNTLNLGLGLNSGALPAGELRRLYAFGNTVSELAISQTPFFRLLSAYAKQPVNDPEFKGLEQRHQWQRRYLFLADMGADTSETVDGTAYTTVAGTAAAGSVPAFFTGAQYKALAAGQNLDISWTTDYKDTGEWKKDGSYYGVTASKPDFIVVGQVIHIPVFNSDAGATNDDITDYGSLVVRVVAKEDGASNSVQTICEVVSNDTLVEIDGSTAIDNADFVYVGSPGVKNQTGTTAAGFDPAGGAKMPVSSLTQAVVNFELVPAAGRVDRERRCYISGSAHAEGSTYPNSWKDKAIVDTYGYTQIFKTTAMMNNTARATVLRGIPDEWARMWKERLIEHKRDIELAALFGEKYKSTNAGGDPIRYMQGAVPYIRDNGYVFDFDIQAKTLDNFIDDLGEFMHPEKGDVSSTIYMCPTNVFSYLSKVGSTGFGSLSLASSNMATFQNMQVKTIAGLDFTQISTPHGTMNLVKNVQLDGSNVKILGINMKHVKYRPLAGNGMNRDTSIYVGIQSLENTGTDKRVDLIQTEAGLDWGMPEAHAVWL
tara:strand:+ start:8953 stop:10590 length:1638 start_codon:yes stop_codon:yes gene_type:complete